MSHEKKQAGSVMLVVQGEGRGHLTQAIAVHEMLVRAGMETCCVVVGRSSRRDVPDFFRKAFSCPVVSLPSPNFVTDKRNKSIRIWPTIWHNLSRMGAYMHGMRIIRKLVAFHQPQLVVNFYEPLLGLYHWMYGRNVKTLSIAHQYVYLHPAFRFPAGDWLQQQLLKKYTRLTAAGSDRILAISPYEMPAVANKNIVIVPPILRSVVRQSSTRNEQFILVYLLNDGYMEEILAWHQKNPETRLHCFTDSRMVKEQHNGLWKVDEDLCFHSLDDRNFLTLLAACSGVATTAGFETICEAHYLGKPVFMVPVAGHFEQYCNARDFASIGAGIYDSAFRLDRFADYIPLHSCQGPMFRSWVDKTESMIMENIRTMVDVYPATPAGQETVFTVQGAIPSNIGAG
jgi:uncharacterized protein (TIGR00661 family)